MMRLEENLAKQLGGSSLEDWERLAQQMGVRGIIRAGEPMSQTQAIVTFTLYDQLLALPGKTRWARLSAVNSSSKTDRPGRKSRRRGAINSILGLPGSTENRPRRLVDSDRTEILCPRYRNRRTRPGWLAA
ncbi:MAG: hypothetical protein R3F36_05550 [Candidatus Competibacteraceae bacterium]